jgi:hypothetical protein
MLDRVWARRAMSVTPLRVRFVDPSRAGADAMRAASSRLTERPRRATDPTTRSPLARRARGVKMDDLAGGVTAVRRDLGVVTVPATP